MIPNARPMKGLRGPLRISRINERMFKLIVWCESTVQPICYRGATA